MRKIDRTGEKWIANNGEDCEIIAYRGSKDLDIQFADGTIITNKAYSNLTKTGIIKPEPYNKSIYNIGYLGVGKYSPKENKNIYSCWHSMFKRCYSNSVHKLHISYVNCIVDKIWHNFQNFAEWFTNNYIENYHLDKDILIKGNKIYSPDTCCFVPHEINQLFTKNNIDRGLLPIGVSFNKPNYVASIKKFNILYNLGSYNTPDIAFNVYKTEKEKHLKNIAEIWKDKISVKVYNAIINYKVEITD